MNPYKIDKEMLEKIFDQVAGKLNPDTDPVPEMGIKGSGDIWCYDPSTKKFIRIHRGIKCYTLSDSIDELGRILVYTAANDVVLINKKELIETGFD